MTRWWLCMLAVTSAGCSAAAERIPGKSDVPSLQVDLGEIRVAPEGHEFAIAIRNVGGEPLSIVEIKPSCGCTTTGNFDPVIPGGGSVSIPLRVRPVGAGPGSSVVKVTTDESPAKVHRMDVVWTAVADIQSEPVKVDFGTIKPGTSHDRSVTLLIRLPHAAVTAWECRPAHRLSLDQEGDAIRIRLSAGDEIGSFSGTIVGTVSGAWPPLLHVPVEWSVRESVEVIPARLFLGSAEPGEQITRTLVLVSATGDEFEIAGTKTVGIPGLEATPAGNGRRVTVMWTAPVAPGAYTGAVEIALQGTDSTSLSVPVSGYTAENTETVGTNGSR